MARFRNMGNLKIEPAFDWPGRNMPRLSATYVVTTCATVHDTLIAEVHSDTQVFQSHAVR